MIMAKMIDQARAVRSEKYYSSIWMLLLKIERSLLSKEKISHARPEAGLETQSKSGERESRSKEFNTHIHRAGVYE